MESSQLKRRKFLTVLLGAAAWPLAARTQQPTVPVVGFVDLGSAAATAHFAAAFRTGLNETGYVEGKNVTIESHWLEGRYDRLPALVADPVLRRVAVIAAPAATRVAIAARAATATIAIVFEQRVGALHKSVCIAATSNARRNRSHLGSACVERPKYPFYFAD
jgi:putative tryptophan/tyrosine transport system substrate-binding protein